MADPVQKPSAECQAYIIRLENALSGIGDLVGVSLGSSDPDTIRRRVKDIRTERDTAQARAEGLEAERDAWKNDHEALRVRIIDLEKVIAHDVANSAARDMRIKELEGELEKLKKTLEAARSATQTYASAEIKANNRAVKAEARVKELEGKLEALKRERHDETLRSGERIQDLTRRCADLEANAAKLSSTEKPDPTRDYNAEIVAARIDALKTLGVNPYDPPVCIHGAAKKKAKTLEHAQKFEDELAQIWELWGAGRPQTPGCVLDAAQEMERANTALHTKLGAIAEMLDGAIMPKNYGRNETGGPIPLTDRVAILIASEAEEKRMVKRWREAAMNEGEEITDARCELDELGAPAHAGEIALTIAARIRAIPGLLRKD